LLRLSSYSYARKCIQILLATYKCLGLSLLGIQLTHQLKLCKEVF